MGHDKDCERKGVLGAACRCDSRWAEEETLNYNKEKAMDKVKLLTQAWDLVNEAGGKASKDRHEFSHILKLLEFEIAAEYNLLQGTKN